MAFDRYDNCYYEVVEGTTKSGRFQSFINNLPWSYDDTVILLDNAAIHKTKEVRHAMNNYCGVIFTPPYSPEYNPIENVFSALKHYNRRHFQGDKYKDVGNVEMIESLISSLPHGIGERVFRKMESLF